MKKRIKKAWFSLIVLLALSGVSVGSFAQSPIAVIPYESENNRIKLSLNLAGAELKMLLDTGATTTILFADKRPQFQSLDISGVSSVSFPAMAQIIKGARISTLELTASTFKVSLNNVILLDDKQDLRTQLLLRYNGILGQEFFAKYAVAVNPETQTISLYPRGTDLSDSYRSHHRLYFQGTAAHVRFTSKLPWEERPSLKEMLLDTGYPGALVIWDRKHFTKASRNQNRRELITSNTGISSRANFRFGKLKFMNSPIFLGANPPPQITDRNGLMGAAILNNFHYAIDFESKSLWVSSKENVGFTRTIDGTLYTPNGEDVVFEDFKIKPSVEIKQIYKFD